MKKLVIMLVTLFMVIGIKGYANSFTAEGHIGFTTDFPVIKPHNVMQGNPLSALYFSTSDYTKLKNSIEAFEEYCAFPVSIPYTLGEGEELYDGDNYSQTVQIQIFNFVVDNYSNTYFNVVLDNPSFMHTATSLSYAFAPESETSDTLVGEIYLFPDYIITENQLEIAKTEADKILADVIEPDMTDEEKTLVLHDYIVDKLSYNSDYVERLSSPGYVENDADMANHTAYGAIMTDKAVCQGYALAYNLLLNKAGVETKFVSSSTINHGWSLVKLDGTWYHVDTTWDDPVDRIIVSHANFLLSDDQIVATGHSSWDNLSLSGSSDKYTDSKYCFNGYRENSDKIIKFKDGYFYDCKENGFIKCKFDGSGRTIITEEEYNAAFAEIYDFDINPYFVNDSKVFVAPSISNLSNGKIFIKNEKSADYSTYVFIAYYSGTKMLKADKLDISAGEYDISDEGADRIGIFVWKADGLKPVAESIYIR